MGKVREPRLIKAQTKRFLNGTTRASDALAFGFGALLIALGLIFGALLNVRPAFASAQEDAALAEAQSVSADTPATAASDQAYALLYDNGDFVFQRGQVPEHSRGRVLRTFTDFEWPSNLNTFRPDWANFIEPDDSLYDPTGQKVAFGDYVRTVIIKDVLSPRTTYQWFWHFSNLTSIEGLSRLNMTDAVSMSEMFLGCSSLATLDLSGLNTANVKDMSLMFGGCSSLKTINLASLQTQSVTDMRGMFSDCGALLNLDLTTFDARNVTDFSAMFANCGALQSIDFTGFKTGSAKDLSFMFSGCSALASLDLSSFSTSLVTTMRDLFNGCGALLNLDISGFKTGRVQDMSSMFANCARLRALDLSHFYTANVTSMYAMFSGCSSLRTLNLSSFNLHSLSPDKSWGNETWHVDDMFLGCESLASVTLGQYFTFHIGGYLPAGQWKSEKTGRTYQAEQVPSLLADTYTREVIERPDDPDPSLGDDEVAILRLYNKHTGEHLFTTRADERDDLTQSGWTDEGIAWIAPASSTTPVYRLYNPYSHDHHYTIDVREYESLHRAGWSQEGVAWFSDDAQSTPLFRLYNGYLTVGAHHFTKNAAEYVSLGTSGWKQEGVAWYALR